MMPRSVWWFFSKIATRTPITIATTIASFADRVVLPVQVGDRALEDASEIFCISGVP